MKHALQEVISQRSLEERIAQLAGQISRDYADGDLVLVAVLSGAFVFAADLCRSLSIDCTIDFVRVSSYGSNTSSSGAIRLVQAPSLDLAGRDVLVVEDIVDTGMTLQWLINYFHEQSAASVRLCVLIDKKERRQVPLEADYAGFTLDHGFLVGYGLDFAERYRNLPSIYTLQDAAS
ncbi:MAG: hypoxanthine phosphoribosyltransferase [Desulfobulbaceae bacterium]|nr:hypoxanthine phosphoribosyltransferase [Desulfobulbaceae bacterium]